MLQSCPKEVSRSLHRLEVSRLDLRLRQPVPTRHSANQLSTFAKACLANHVSRE